MTTASRGLFLYRVCGEKIAIFWFEFHCFLSHSTGCNQRRKVIPKYTQIGYFTLDLDGAKEYLYAKSTKRRILSWRDIHVNVFIWIKTMSPHSFGCEDFFVIVKHKSKPCPKRGKALVIVSLSLHSWKHIVPEKIYVINRNILSI